MGFEPTGVLPPLVFKTSALVHSAMPPGVSLRQIIRRLRQVQTCSGVFPWKREAHEPSDQRRSLRVGNLEEAGDAVRAWAKKKRPAYITLASRMSRLSPGNRLSTSGLSGYTD